MVFSNTKVCSAVVEVLVPGSGTGSRELHHTIKSFDEITSIIDTLNGEDKSSMSLSVNFRLMMIGGGKDNQYICMVSNNVNLGNEIDSYSVLCTQDKLIGISLFNDPTNIEYVNLMGVGQYDKRFVVTKQEVLQAVSYFYQFYDKDPELQWFN